MCTRKTGARGQLVRPQPHCLSTHPDSGLSTVTQSLRRLPRSRRRKILALAIVIVHTAICHDLSATISIFNSREGRLLVPRQR